MNTDKIFSPTEIGNIKIKNRIALAPMTRGRAGKERIPNDLMATYYKQRANAGMIITEATVISKEGNGWNESPGIYTEAMVEGWKRVTASVRLEESPIFLQLWHCGRASHSDFHDGELPFSASAVKLNGDHIHTPKGKKEYEVPRAMSKDDIKRTIEDFRTAAANAKRAGFSGVEVHGANGYLINQFLDSRSNQRTDEYGGSVENRFRFFREALTAVLDIWPAHCVGARLSPNGVFNDMGSKDFRETYTYATQELEKLGIGYLHVMDGLAFGFHEKGEPMQLSEFRQLFSRTLIGNCGYTLDSAKKAINAGHADVIAFGRPFITNPDLVTRFMAGNPLAPHDNMSEWYSPGADGYTSYPTYAAKN